MRSKRRFESISKQFCKLALTIKYGEFQIIWLRKHLHCITRGECTLKQYNNCSNLCQLCVNKKYFMDYFDGNEYLNSMQRMLASERTYEKHSHLGEKSTAIPAGGKK